MARSSGTHDARYRRLAIGAKIAVGMIVMAAAPAMLFATIGAASPPPTPAIDVLIRGGTIYDGSEAMRPYIGDVAIAGDRIAYVGPRAIGSAKRTIDATGMVIAPGFIDPHTHPDRFLSSADPAVRQVPAWLAQGVTTIVTGNDGVGAPEVARYFAGLRTPGIGVNVATYVGFGTIRGRVIGDAARAPTVAELDREKALVASAMCEGALGLSTGLFYPPQSFSTTDEVIAVAKEAGRRGGIYDTHTRDYADFTVGFMNGYREALAIGRQAGLPVHLSHIKTLGPKAWGKSVDVIKLIDDARAHGQKVSASQYPYTGNGTGISSMFVPLWANDGGHDALLKRLADPAIAGRLRREMIANIARAGGADKFLFNGPNQPWTGKYLDALAREWQVEPVDAAIRIVSEGGDQSMIGFVMSPVDLLNFMKQPWTLTDSDGSDGHPRQYGTFPQKYREYVVRQKAIGLPFFIRNSSGRTADVFGLRRRGYLKAGYFADVVVLDPRVYRPRNDFTRFDVLAEGVAHLFVNGAAAIDGGKMTVALSGRPLPHTPTPGTCPAPSR